VVASSPGDNWDAAWSPDSKRIVYSRAGSGLHVVRLDGSGDRVISSEPVGSFALSPDGKSIAIVARGGLYLLRGGREKLLSEHAGSQLAWSPNGRWIATWDYRPGREILLTDVSGAQGPLVGAGVLAAWSPDGRRLAYEAPDGLRVFDLRTRRSEPLTRETAYERRDYRDPPLGLAWAPDGRSVAYVAGSLDFERGIESGDLRIVTLSGHARTVVDAERAYGGRIVSLAWTQPPRTIRYQTPEPAPPTRVTSESALAPGPISRLAADGSRVASSRARACSPGRRRPAS
jgi:Tol biopolymer transport system component